ncbi:MAG: hypothetical protein AABX49_02415, partial [Nanoarchaeota archaeon]
NSEEIEINNSVIKLKSNSSTANWATYSQEIFSISKAYYDPLDKTSKVDSKDGNEQGIEPNKIATFIFNSALNNGDIINLYLDNNEITNIYLCPAYEECNSTNLGQVNFPDLEGYYNITVQNLNSSSKIFNLNSDLEIKLDYINSSDVNIIKFLYEPEDKTSQINAQENTTLSVDGSRVFDIVFNSQLQDNDLVQIYLKNDQTTNIYLCNPAEECNSTNLGQINFQNQEGYYNITVQNLNSSSKIFNLNSDLEIKLDFAEAIRVTETNHSETNITYQETANISTLDFIVENLDRWDLLITEENLLGQNISYEYSMDSGENWNVIPEDKNLSEVNSTKIKIKAILSSNTTETPELTLINLTYSTKTVKDYYEMNNSGIISTIKNENITINSSSNIEFKIATTESLSDISFNVTKLEDTRPSTLVRLKEIEILSPGLLNKLDTATIKIYYTEDEIRNLKESTLKFYYYNETSQEWQSIKTVVNEENNYLEAGLEHFSIYGVFGEETPSSSSSSGGPGGKREFTRAAEAPAQQPQSSPKLATGETVEESQENTEQENILVQTEVSPKTLTGNIVNIGRILTDGKTNKSLWILLAILIVAYIITKIEEQKKENK